MSGNYPTDRLDYAHYEFQFCSDGGTKGYILLYVLLTRCFGLLEVGSLQLCPERERIGPFCLLKDGQCSACLQVHRGACVTKLQLLHPGMSKDDAQRAADEVGAGQNRLKKQQYHAKQKARAAGQSTEEAQLPVYRRDLSKTEQDRREKYKEQAALQKCKCHDFGYIPCRIHSRTFLGSAMPKGDRKNPHSLEWRPHWDTDFDAWKWYTCCHKGSRCQRTEAGVGGQAPVLDDPVARALYEDQEDERYGRKERDRWVTSDSTEWDGASRPMHWWPSEVTPGGGDWSEYQSRSRSRSTRR